MDILLVPLYNLVDTILAIYVWILIFSVALSWLIAFGVVNTYNQLVSTFNEFFIRVTEPALMPIRRMLPDLGGLDISPVVLILFIWFIRQVLSRFVIAVAGYA